MVFMHIIVTIVLTVELYADVSGISDMT